MDLYDKDGRSITMDEYVVLLGNPEYRVVQQDTLPKGRYVSTIWLGSDSSFGGSPPLIFETMVYREHGDFREMLCERYPTEEDARAGHALAVLLASDDEWKGYE